MKNKDQTIYFESIKSWNKKAMQFCQACIQVIYLDKDNKQVVKEHIFCATFENKKLTTVEIIEHFMPIIINNNNLLSDIFWAYNGQVSGKIIFTVSENLKPYKSIINE